MMKFMFFICSMIMMILVKNYYKMFYFNLCFFITLILIFSFNGKDSSMYWMISEYYGCDYYSYFLILLSVWILGLMFMSLEWNESELSVKFMIFIFMLLILMNFFLSMNLFVFYLFFELILIPTFFLIIYWGGSPERLSAGFYLFMYMLVFSLPLLYYVFFFYYKIGSMNFLMLEETLKFYSMGFGSFMIMMMVFLIKLPIYLFHIWLPKAHVEAPVYGSMILAAILLKLGGYGLIRMMMILNMNCLKYSYVIFSIGIMGGLFVSCLCLVQIDMKMLVAYSSIVHMNFMLSGMMTMYKLGLFSALIVMISHGLCSSSLFFMVNLYYKWSLSRLLILNKGVLNLFPSLSFWWFVFCSANFSFPFSLNFIGEIFLISLILNWEKIFMIFLMMICFFSSAYSLYLYSYIQHGSWMSESNAMIIGYLSDYLILIFHFYPLCLILLNLVMFV